MAQVHGMNGGEGPLSYAQNSSYQGAVMDVVKPIIEEEITKKLDMRQFASNGFMDSFWIADFGCSTGLNSFLANKQNFNQKDVPKAVTDPTCQAWNKGDVHYVGARQEVYDAYSSQYAKDIELFLKARAQELVSGGLMALVVPAIPTKFDYSNPSYKEKIPLYHVGSILVDMAKKGRLDEAKIGSFNFPTYFTFPEELKEIIERNGSYSIERMEILDNPGKYASTNAHARALLFRAISGELLTNHFGCEIINELFDRYTQKLEASPALLLPENDKTIIIFVLLKRRVE
ncbi:Loganic acid O-methyltransferase [Sesamum alatum]|uniref:Loganic acid O-methyltransferase n=1 Tax=Sesamum alatum TaxID=300844 RepID=A0AAE2CBR9_9LAMI|nr:Loganic acid O-methyltransferase [Sesamum alatum]